MEREAAEKEIGILVGEIFSPAGVQEINWKVDGQPGHPFTIGPKHVAYASDHCSGMLGQEVCEKIGCAHPKCGKPYGSHTHDTVLLLKLKGPAIESKVKEVLFNAQVTNLMAQAKIDGFVFVETPEKFRITKEVPV
jgi:hypothetical protein